MIVTTTQTVQNRSIQNYLGLVSGESILGHGFVESVFAGINNPEGCTGKCKITLEDARQAAIKEMEEKALQLGADAIIAVDVDYAEIKDEMLMVAVNGTAVKLIEYRD